MWRAATTHVASGYKYQLLDNEVPLSFDGLFRLLDKSDDFCEWYTAMLADSDFDAFYWEHPPLTRGRLELDAEFVLLDAPTLACLEAEPAPFQPLFDERPGEDVIVFPNLGGDAMLIVPCPIAARDVYPHLAAFLRDAPASQIRSVWRQTAKTVRGSITSAPRWLSTAGLGVAWLHVRIDARPKYYSHVPYTRYP